MFDGQAQDTIVVRREDLFVGHAFAGPAIVVEETATTVVPPDHDVSIDGIGSLIIRGKDTK